MNETRILTVRQPWAWAIIHGGKYVENRVRNIAGSYRGPVAIHAGLATFEKNNAAASLHRKMHGGEVSTVITFGAIIGVVDLVDVHQASPDDHGQIRCSKGARYGTWARSCSDWAHAANYHLVLANPRSLTSPIEYRGSLGLRHLDEETIARIFAQIGA